MDEAEARRGADARARLGTVADGHPGETRVPAPEGGGLDSHAWPLPDGERPAVPGFEILGELGRGAMGVVYRARDEGLKRLVALKVMNAGQAADPRARTRFLREARAMAAVRSDHVITIYHVGEASGVPYLAMELLDGETLEDRLGREGRLAPPEAWRIAREAAEGLEAAHARGLTHRDVKPANLFLESPRGRIKVLDFGLASAVEGDDRVTHSGMLMGTPAYMAPEQAGGSEPDPRADLFSLGVMLYQMLTGVRPFAGPNLMSVLAALASHEPPPPRTLSDAPGPLSDLTMRLLSKDPGGRPASARAVVAELDTLVDEPAPPPAAAPAPRGAGRWPRVAAGIALGAVMALATFQVVIRIQDKDGRETTITAPEGSRVTVERGGEVVARVPGEAPAAGPPSYPSADPAWLSSVQALPVDGRLQAVAEELRRRNPGAEVRLTGLSDDSGRIFAITADPFRGVRDLTPLQALPGLQSVEFIGHPEHREPALDLRALSPLKQLWRVGGVFVGFRDLTPLAGMPHLSNVGSYVITLPDLSPLRGIPLKSIGFDQFSDADRLIPQAAGFPLEYLEMACHPGVDLAPLRKIPTLRSLRITAPEGLANPGALAGLPVTRLVLDGRFPDLSPLKSMPDLRDCELSGIDSIDLSPLAGSGIARLTIAGFGKVRDLAPLRGVPLRKLGLVGPNLEIEDLSPLASISTLEEVGFHTLPDGLRTRLLPALRALPGLKLINGKPAAEFWKEFDARPR